MWREEFHFALRGPKEASRNLNLGRGGKPLVFLILSMKWSPSQPCLPQPMIYGGPSVGWLEVKEV